jgi:magnesium transporter
MAPYHAKEGSLSAYVVTATWTSAAADTAGAMRARLTTREIALADPIFIIGQEGALVGAVRLSALLRAPAETLMQALIEAPWPTVALTTTREEAASLAIRHEAPALAVLDHDGLFVGAVSATSVMAILRDEHLEDLHHMVGILGRSDAAKAALTAPPYRRALYRLPWLLVGLAGSAAATALMAGAEAQLSAHIAVAFFIPAIIYLADAIGTQAEAVAVRGLSLTDGGPLRLLLGELGTGALLGLVLAVLSFAAIYAIFDEARLAVAVASALFIAGTVATGIGFLLPWVFQRYGLDPALAAGPLATVLQDVLSLAVYLAMVSLLLT